MISQAGYTPSSPCPHVSAANIEWGGPGWGIWKHVTTTPTPTLSTLPPAAVGGGSRVTAFCAERAMAEFGELRKVKIEFSKRGGLHYSQTIAYHEYLRIQQQGDKIFLQKREPVLKMLHHELMIEYPHYMRAGLQLADVVASAFYQAADALGPGQWSTGPAIALEPIMAKEKGHVRDFGVALFPTPDWRGELTNEQQEIFQDYGYGFVRW